MNVLFNIFVQYNKVLKGILIKYHKFWQRQVIKFEALVLSSVILWFKPITAPFLALLCKYKGAIKH